LSVPLRTSVFVIDTKPATGILVSVSIKCVKTTLSVTLNSQKVPIVLSAERMTIVETSKFAMTMELANVGMNFVKKALSVAPKTT
jgi:hypothetical protein